MTRRAIVTLESLTHRYGDRIALDAVSLEVEEGSIFAILGPNGGGKTTLFKILTTLMPPSGGSAKVAGADVVTQRAAVREKIGVVFQNPSLDARLSVGENLRCQGALYGLSGSSLGARSDELLERFGVADRKGDRVQTLSGGLQRRVELAKAMLHRPPVLILDEPSTGLDPGARGNLFDALAELQQRDGITTLLTTHFMDEADRCDRVAIVDRGSLVAWDTPTALKRIIGGDVLTITSAQADSLGERITARFQVNVEQVGGTLRMELDRGHAFVPDLIEAFPGEIDSVTVGKPTLDDVFVHFTGHRFENPTDPTNPAGKGKNKS